MREIYDTGQSWNGYMGMLWDAEWSGGWQRSWFGRTSNSAFVAICWGHQKRLSRSRLVAFDRSHSWYINPISINFDAIPYQWSCCHVSDLGKILLLPRFGSLPQWAVVGNNLLLLDSTLFWNLNNWEFWLNKLITGIFAGDTFPLGCAFDESNIHHKVNRFRVINYEAFYS